eukprot:6188683-Pleurochrysis_carterae.AAC.2
MSSSQSNLYLYHTSRFSKSAIKNVIVAGRTPSGLHVPARTCSFLEGLSAAPFVGLNCFTDETCLKGGERRNGSRLQLKRTQCPALHAVVDAGGVRMLRAQRSQLGQMSDQVSTRLPLV